MHEIVLLRITGKDKPGLTSSFSEVLAQHDVNILDIGQAVIHNTLSMGMLIEVPSGAGSAPVLKELLFKAHDLGIDLKFEAIDEADYEGWVTEQGKPRYIITLFGPELTAKHIERVSHIIADHDLNIDILHRLSGRQSLDRDHDDAARACVEISVRGVPKNIEAMRREFLETSQALNVDIAFQEDNVYRRTRRLICFDMDSTLIQTEVIDELAYRAGVGDQVAAITESAMRGELDFQDSFRKRLALLEGLDESVLEDIAQSLPLTPGAERLFQTLNQLGYKTAILSGGFTYFGKHLQQLLGIDYVYANELEIADGKVTGHVKGTIVDGKQKAVLLQQIAERENIRLEQVIAVGDGANDLPMLNLAGLGIAFHAKPVVKRDAEQSISNFGLDGILYLIGVRDREVVESC